MAIVKMLAVTLVGAQQEMETAAKQLILSESFQPLPVEKLINDKNDREKIKFEKDNPYDELLSKVSIVWKVTGEPLPAPRAIDIPKEYTLTGARYQIAKLADKLDLWQKLREVLKESGYSPSDVLRSSYLNAHFGKMPTDNYERLIENDQLTFVAKKLTEANGFAWVFVLAPFDKEAEMEQLLESLKFVSNTLYSVKSPEEVGEKELLTLLSKQIEEHASSMDGLAAAAREVLATRGRKLEMLYQEIYYMQRVYDVCSKRGEIEGVYMLSGWVREDGFEELKNTIGQMAPSTTILVDEVKEISVPAPTLLQNCKLFRAFEDIVAMYSLPSYSEFDPTNFVALTFTLFFGFMFGDIGHGLIIFLGALYAQKKQILTRSLAFVMKCAGLSSMFFGVLYGSIFGVEELFEPLWLSPMHSTTEIITASICVGFATISLGMLLNVVQQFRAKNYGKMLFDGQCLAGLALYWTFAALIIVSINKNEATAGYVKPLLITAGVLMLLMIFKGVLGKILFKEEGGESPAFSIFGIVEACLGFLSNTASFVRLAAFALNHVGLSMAVIMLSQLMKNLPGGIVFQALMFAVGNVGVAVLEGLIVFIQTLRLEYYEFFGKFFKGGGQEFKPVVLKQK